MFRCWPPLIGRGCLVTRLRRARRGKGVGGGKGAPTNPPTPVVCNPDTTFAILPPPHPPLPRHKPRKLRRLYDQREKMMKSLTKEYFAHNAVKMVDGSEPVL